MIINLPPHNSVSIINCMVIDLYFCHSRTIPTGKPLFLLLIVHHHVRPRIDYTHLTERWGSHYWTAVGTRLLLSTAETASLDEWFRKKLSTPDKGSNFWIYYENMWICKYVKTEDLWIRLIDVKFWNLLQSARILMGHTHDGSVQFSSVKSRTASIRNRGLSSGVGPQTLL